MTIKNFFPIMYASSKSKPSIQVTNPANNVNSNSNSNSTLKYIQSNVNFKNISNAVHDNIVKPTLSTIQSLYHNLSYNDPNLSATSKMALALRKKYIISFLFLCIISTVLYIVNPYGVFTTYLGPTMFIILFLGIFLVTMIVFYDFFFKNPSESDINIPKTFYLNTIYILFSLVVSIGFIVLLLWLLGMFSSKPSTSNIEHFIINFLLLFGILCIIYKIFSFSNFGKSPITRIIMYSLFYIPCLFLVMFESILKEYNQTSKSMVFLLFFEIILILLYFYMPGLTVPLYTQGGKQLINQPVSLSSSQTIATYETLNDGHDYTYQYALSFWFYIDSMPPSTNTSYTTYTNILTYGNNPIIQYNGMENTLLISIDNTNNHYKQAEQQVSAVDIAHSLEDQIQTVPLPDIYNLQNEIQATVGSIKNLPIPNEMDRSGKRIIYKNKNVLLQKWNNIILNYTGGTLDIFYNGELVKSAIEVTPYLSYDTLVVGSDKGISGDLCNLLYFNKPLDVFKIKKLYESMKTKNPPSIHDNNTTIIPPK